MAISPARVAAFEILLRVERENGYSSELLHLARYSKLSPADHGLTMELVMGVLRWRSLLDAEIARFSSQKIEKLDAEVLTALRMAAFQIAFLDRVPARAAVHERVGTRRSQSSPSRISQQRALCPTQFKRIFEIPGRAVCASCVAGRALVCCLRRE